MTKENNNQGLYIGAAVVTGILGTLSALLHSNRTVQEWTDQAKGAAQHVLEKGEMMNKKMVLGGVAGGLIGAAVALLLAPKSGAELIKDLSHPFSNQEHKRSTSRKSPSRKFASHKKSAHSTKKGGAVRKRAAKTEEPKPHKATAKRKSSGRRRTATSALKHAAATAEKSISEAAAV